MIVAAPSTSSSALLLTTQTDHAAFAAELLSLWRDDGLPENPRRDALLRATREHDNGWAETDSAPRSRPDGRPHDFTSLPSAERLELWRRGVDRWRDRDPAVAVYLVRHARALHENRAGGDRAGKSDGDPQFAGRWRSTLESWRELEEELLIAAELTEEELAREYAFLALADVLSLAVCARWTEPQTRSAPGGKMRFRVDVPFAAERPGEPPKPLTLHLDPLPLAGATSFQVRARRIPDRRYESDADLALELAGATWDTLGVRVASWRDGSQLRL